MTPDAFTEREQAFENKFKHDEELRFKVHARATRYFGEWAAKEMSFTPADISAYADELCAFDLNEPGIGDILRKVKSDLKQRAISTTDHHLQNAYNECLERAKSDLRNA